MTFGLLGRVSAGSADDEEDEAVLVVGGGKW